MIDLNTTTLSYSGIKEILKSCDHFIRYKTERSEPTAAMRLGSAFDRYLLEGVPPLIMPEGINLRTNEGKAQKAALEEEAKQEKRELVSVEDMARLMAMKESVMRHPVARSYLEMPGETQKEVTIDYQPFQEYAPVRLHMKMDRYIDETQDPTIIDLKTCASADIDDITRAIANLKYYIQATVYSIPDMMRAMMPDFRFLFVETAPPYGVQMVSLSPAWIDKGMEDVHFAVKRFSQWLAGQIGWTGYSDHTVTIDMPSYLRNKERNAGCAILPPGTIKVQPGHSLPVEQGATEALPSTPKDPEQTAEPSPAPASAVAPTKRSDKGRPRSPRKPAHDVDAPNPGQEPPQSPAATATGSRVGDAILDLHDRQRVNIYDSLLADSSFDTEVDFKVAIGLFESQCGTPFMRWSRAHIDAFAEQIGIRRES